MNSKAISKKRFLVLERERQLLEKFQTTQCQEALSDLINAYSPLIFSIVYRFREHHDIKDDLISEGTIGFIEAAKKFQPSKSERLSTYAYKWVLFAVQNYIHRNRFLPLGMPETNDPDGDPMSFLQEIPCENDTQDTIVAHEQENAYKLLLLGKAMSQLTAQEKFILEQRWLCSTIKSLKSLSKELGYCQEHVRQIEKRAFTKVHKHIKMMMWQKSRPSA